MNFSNAAYDLADTLAERERQAGIAQAQRQLNGAAGSPFCIDCGEPIEEARRAALPHAMRCVECETFHERQKRRCA